MIHFLFSCNLSEIVTIFVAIVGGFPAPLAPDLMRRPPRDPRAALITPPNVLTWVALVVLVLVQWWATAWSPLAGLLGTVALAPGDRAAIGVAILWPVLVLEAAKSVHRRSEGPLPSPRA